MGTFVDPAIVVDRSLPHGSIFDWRLWPTGGSLPISIISVTSSKQMHKQTDRETDSGNRQRETKTEPDRQTNGQTVRQTDRQAGRRNSKERDGTKTV